MRSAFRRLLREQDGQDLIEYSFLAVFIVFAAASAIQGIGAALQTQYSNIASQIAPIATPPSPPPPPPPPPPS